MQGTMYCRGEKNKCLEKQLTYLVMLVKAIRSSCSCQKKPRGEVVIMERLVKL